MASQCAAKQEFEQDVACASSSPVPRSEGVAGDDHADAGWWRRGAASAAGVLLLGLALLVVIAVVFPPPSNEASGRSTQMLDPQLHEVLAAVAEPPPAAAAKGSTAAEWLNEYLKHHSKTTVYNRIPKCGSTSMKGLLDQLHVRNKFVAVHLKNEFWGYTVDAGRLMGEGVIAADKAAVQRAKRARAVRPPVVDAHNAFVDMRKWDWPRPVYYNVVRDPVSRLISAFYYHQNPSRHKGLHAGLLAKAMGDKKFIPEKHTLTACVKTPSCLKYIEDDLIAPLQAMQPPGANISFPVLDEQLASAQQVMDTEFLLVFPIEAALDGLQLLECLLPHQFTGATEIWQQWEEAGRSHRYQTHNRWQPPKEEEDTELLSKLVAESGETRLYAAAVRKLCRVWQGVRQGRRCRGVPKHPPEICASVAG